MKQLSLLAAIVSALVACSAVGEGSNAARSALSAPASTARIDQDGSYLLYLHPKIVEDQGLPASSPENGDFRYGAILDHFRQQGFTVLGEQRPKDADATVYAQRSLAEIERLLSGGVKPQNITIVGASKGAYIASLVSHLARNPSLNYVLLAGCSAGTVAYMRDNNMDLYGNVLAIRDVADTQWAGSCAEVFAFSSGIRRTKEIVLSVGSGHGIIFGPLEEWVRPTREWARTQD